MKQPREAAEEAGISIHQLNYIERLGLVQPRFVGTHRIYGDGEMARLRDVCGLLDAGFKPGELRAAIKLRDGSTPERRPSQAEVFANLLIEASNTRATLELPVPDVRSYNTTYKLVGRLAKDNNLVVDRRKEGDVLHIRVRDA